jgi:hypothetical protein
MSGFICTMVGATFSVAAVAQILRSKNGVSAYGNAQIDTAQSKFGGASALFDGSGDYLTSPDFRFPESADMTVEFWFRPANTDERFDYITTNSTANGRFFLNTTTDNQIQGFIGWSGTGGNLLLTSTTTYSANTWYHFAFVRSSNNYYLFLDGNLEASETLGYSRDIVQALLLIALRPGAGGDAAKGHMDEIRVSNTARYTANFTPSTTPFVNDANTLLLLHMDGTDGSTFFEDDNGVRSPKGIQAIGNAQIDTAQSKFGGSSLLTDTTGDYLDCGVILPASANWTVEYWWYATQSTANRSQFGQGAATTANDLSVWATLNLTGITVRMGSSSVKEMEIVGSFTFTAGVWYHISLVRNGSTFQLFINGTSYGTDTTSATINQNNFYFCNNATTGANGWGSWDEFRVSDTARYTANFTAPTQAFVNDANTLLLIHCDGTDGSTVFRDDNGIIGKNITAVGNAQISTAQSQFGGSSALFDGLGDYLLSPPSNSFAFGTEDFTLECWVRAVDTSNQCLISARVSSSGSPTGNNASVMAIVNNKLAWSNGIAWNYTTSTFPTSQWNHCAVSRQSGTLRIFLNGVKEYEASQTVDLTGNRTIGIGAFEEGSLPFEGHIDEVRVSNTARYTANFTPNTIAFTPDANTLLLLHMDGANASTAFIDSASRSQKGITAVGNAQIDTAQSKFGGASALFDGTGDGLSIQPSTDFILGTNNWTVEFWIRPISTGYNTILFDTRATTGANALTLYYTSNTVTYFTGGSIRITGSNWTVNTWQHIALVRNGNDHKLYINGTQSGSTYTATNSITSVQNFVTVGCNSDTPYGASFNGHIDEVRVSNTARYTANFTPSTTPFVNDANTLLLIHADGTDGSTVFFDDNGIAPYTP